MATTQRSPARAAAAAATAAPATTPVTAAAPFATAAPATSVTAAAPLTATAPATAHVTAAPAPLAAPVTAAPAPATAAGPGSSQPAPPEAPKFGDLFSGWPQRTSSAPVSQTNFHFPRRTASEGSAAQTTAFRAAAARLSAATSAPTFNTNGGLFTSSAAPQPPPSGSIPPPPAHSATNLASPRAGRRIVSVGRRFTARAASTPAPAAKQTMKPHQANVEAARAALGLGATPAPAPAGLFSATPAFGAKPAIGAAPAPVLFGQQPQQPIFPAGPPACTTLSTGWLEDFSRILKWEEVGSTRAVDAKLWVRGSNSFAAAADRCFLSDGLTEIEFDVASLGPLERANLAPGNVVCVKRVKIRSATETPHMAIERTELVQGQPRRPDANAKADATPAAGSVHLLTGASSAGTVVVVRVAEVLREPNTVDRWRVEINDGDATLSCLLAAGVHANVAPRSLVSVRSAGRADLDGTSTVVLQSITVVAPPPPQDKAAPVTTPTKKKPLGEVSTNVTPEKAIVQANLLSPDYGKSTFLRLSPTGVENFPPPFAVEPRGGRDWRSRWRDEIDGDAIVFAGARAVAGDAFEKRARLLREACSRQQIIVSGGDWRARKDVDSLFLEKMLRASVLASAAPVDEAGLASLYEAVLAAAESRREDDGVCLVAAQVLVSIHSLDRLSALKMPELRGILAALKPLAPDAYKAAKATREGKGQQAAAKVIRAVAKTLPDAGRKIIADATEKARLQLSERAVGDTCALAVHVFGKAQSRLAKQAAAKGAAAPQWTAAAQAGLFSTASPPYQPTRDQEQNTSGRRMEMVYHSISTNAAYRGKSYEEIRLEDYQSGRAGKVASPPKDCTTKGPLVADQRRIGLEMERAALDLAAAAETLGLKALEALERAGAVEALTVALSRRAPAAAALAFGASSAPKLSQVAGLYVGGGAIDSTTGKACTIVAQSGSRWIVKLSGADTNTLRRADQLTANPFVLGASAPVASPFGAPAAGLRTSAAAPAPAPSLFGAPAAGAARPASGAGAPAPLFGAPAAGAARPASGAGAPAPLFGAPAAGAARPASGARAPPAPVSSVAPAPLPAPAPSLFGAPATGAAQPGKGAGVAPASLQKKNPTTVTPQTTPPPTIVAGMRIRVDKQALRSDKLFSAEHVNSQRNWSYAKVLSVTTTGTTNLVGAFVPGPPRYRIQYEDDDSIVEETLRAPWYELVEGESRGKLELAEDANYADTISLAASLASARPTACVQLRLALRRGTPLFGAARKLEDDAKQKDVETKLALLRELTSKPPGCTDTTLLNLVRAGVLPSDGNALDQLADPSARELAIYMASWHSMAVNQHLAERINRQEGPWKKFGPEFSGAQITSETSKYIVRFVNEVNTHQDKDAPYLLFGGDFGGATWPNDGPRKISKFAGAVVVADAVRAADAAHKLAFTITATVAQRRELASLNAQAGRSSSWRRLTEENFPALTTAVAQARTAVTRITGLQKQLEGSRRMRALIKRPIDEGLLGSCLFERGVARLEAEVAAGSALLDAAYEHLAAIETVGARRYALGAICEVLGKPKPRVDWRACWDTTDDLSSLFREDESFDSAWRAAAGELEGRVAMAVVVDEEADPDHWSPGVRAISHLDDRYLNEGLDFDEDDDLWIEGDRLSSYAAAAAVEAASGTLAADLRDAPALAVARKASESLARRRRAREDALTGRSTVIARKWPWRVGDEAVWVSPGEPDRRCVILARSPSRTTTTPRWRILADNIGETQIFSTSLRMDLAFLNEGKDLDAREKALATAERTIAARSRAEQRQALRDARTTLGSDVTSPVDWRAAVFDDKEIWLASEADFLRGVDCKLLKLTLETVATTAKCSYAEAFDACRRAPQDTLATLSACLTDDVRAMARTVDRAVDRLQASSATLAAAASAAAREVADRRSRFQDIIDAASAVAPSRTVVMPAVLSRDALNTLLDQKAFEELSREDDLEIIAGLVKRIKDVFAAAGAAPSRARIGYAVGDEDLTRPATLERYVDQLALADGAAPQGDDLPFQPAADLSRVFASSNQWLNRARRRCRYWADRWKELKTCPICWDALPKAETMGAHLGTKLCAHFDEVCVSCAREHCKNHLADSSGITEKGLPCVEWGCSTPLTLDALAATFTVMRGHGDGDAYPTPDQLLRPAEVAKAKRFVRAAKLSAFGGAACWCPNGCEDSIVDLTSPTPQCKVCATVVCKSCQQVGHDGPCAAAASALDETLWRGNWQRCPGCKTVVEKKEACDHMRCRCGTLFCYNCGARGHGCPTECTRPRVFDPAEDKRPVNRTNRAADY